MGPLDYQAAMLDLYIKNVDKKTVALELPTGSGKTLVGLLIGEYRRRKIKKKYCFYAQLTNWCIKWLSNQI